MLNFKVWLYFSHSSLITVSRRKSLKRENKSSIAISKPSNKREVKKKKWHLFITKGKIFNEPVMGDTISWPCQNSPKQWFSNFIVGYIKKKSSKIIALLNWMYLYNICIYVDIYWHTQSDQVYMYIINLLPYYLNLIFSILSNIFYSILLYSIPFYSISFH